MRMNKLFLHSNLNLKFLQMNIEVQISILMRHRKLFCAQSYQNKKTEMI